MFVFLLVLGAIISGAGFALLASGVSIQDHTFDPTNITPGTTAVIGGFILIGLGLVVRALLHVERALNARSAARLAAAADIPIPIEAVGEPAVHSVPPKLAGSGPPPPLPLGASSSPPPLGDPGIDRLREKFPNLGRIENAPVVEETDISLLPKPPARHDEQLGEARTGALNGRANGSAATKMAPPFDANARVAARPERSKNVAFESLWPKPQRSTTDGHAATTPSLQPPPLPHAGETTALPHGTAPMVAPPDAHPSVSVLKSGVVEGMAYTLYSDGSIEAQLPQGTLRFGSIAELRSHIEHHS